MEQLRGAAARSGSAGHTVHTIPLPAHKDSVLVARGELLEPPLPEVCGERGQELLVLPPSRSCCVFAGGLGAAMHQMSSALVATSAVPWAVKMPRCVITTHPRQQPHRGLARPGLTPTVARALATRPSLRGASRCSRPACTTV